MSNNPFLIELLGLQQDGREAISAPTNWTQSKPLLEVRTELDLEVSELASSCLLGESNRTGRWHFLIGSPGNGKSAAVGQLVRTLINERGCRIVDDKGVDIRHLTNDSVPYSLDVFEDDLEYASVKIVQDASVVRNPYASDVDPARDLIDTLRLAWERGISLVVCTNRGVLEKAFRDTYLNTVTNQEPWHKAILRHLIDSPNNVEIPPIPLTGRHCAFDLIKTTSRGLDNNSLILRNRGIFDKLIQEAIKPNKWTACGECSAAALCPFKANRDWLANEVGREHTVTAFRRAEVLSSQVIVFREALAAISFLLAGCARDYHGKHPCDWVQDLISQGDLFGLATRRIYMSLFSSNFPRGLEATEESRTLQVEYLQALNKILPAGAAKKALMCVLDTSAPSTDVGISRLLGGDGVFSQLDPIQGPLPASYYDKWDGNYAEMIASESPLISAIDRQCFEIWQTLEVAAENMASHESAHAYWATRRWSTQFTLHLGVLAGGIAYSAPDIDEFTELLELLWKAKDSRSTDDKKRLRELEGLVQRLLNRDEGNGDSVQLGENVKLEGRWLDGNMQPKVSASPASGSLTIAVNFGKSSESTMPAAEYTTLAAPMYLWLKQRAHGTIDHRCLPSDLLSDAMDAKGRAVAKSSYATERDDVLLSVKGEGESFKVYRIDGEVVVDVDN